MKKISKNAFRQLTAEAKVVESDWFGPKVLQLSDSNYLKLFRIKRLFSSALIFPYAKRFALNVDKLKALSIPTVEVISFFDIPFIKKAAVLYSPLPGETLRSNAVKLDGTLCRKLGEFISTLHANGVYFRSLHLGNIVLTPRGDLGLIDIADMKFYARPLTKQQRLRNLKHLNRYPEDTQRIRIHLDGFVKGYQSDSLQDFGIEACI